MYTNLSPDKTSRSMDNNAVSKIATPKFQTTTIVEPIVIDKSLSFGEIFGGENARDNDIVVGRGSSVNKDSDDNDLGAVSGGNNDDNDNNIEEEDTSITNMGNTNLEEDKYNNPGVTAQETSRQILATTRHPLLLLVVVNLHPHHHQNNHQLHKNQLPSNPHTS